jgi:hypothetical protein
MQKQLEGSFEEATFKSDTNDYGNFIFFKSIYSSHGVATILKKLEKTKLTMPESFMCGQAIDKMLGGR